MAAYAALVSLMHILEQIQNHHQPPISLDEAQVESLTEKIAFLQDFLEAYKPCGDLELEGRIADAAHTAEDVIESHLVDRILAQSTTTHDGELISSVNLYQGLQSVIQDMEFIRKDVMEIKDNTGIQHQPQRISTDVVSSSTPSTEQNSTMLGFDDFVYEILDKLIGKQSGRQIIPIVGMGGIGKTTLARNVYQKRIVLDYFDIRAWVTISQEYSVKEILLEILCQNNQESRESLSQMTEVELREKLHKSLFGRRYLIIMDDMWSAEALNKVKFIFPNKDSESRIVITTRLSKRALNLDDALGVEMKFLDEDKSWELFCKNAFGGHCPIELEEIGKKIAKNCKGLPLSIVVIGGLLARSKQAVEYWKSIAENLNSIVNLDNNERCLKILHVSYDQLPVHLKPCFLYMGVFPEDHEIRISQLIKLWVAEGFLKPINGKCLEETAEKYVLDLIDRNLILVRKWGSLSRKISSCTIHDLLRDLCLREAQKEKFLCVTREHSLDISQGMNTERRLAIHPSTSKEEYHHQVIHDSKSVSLLRSLICYFKKGTLSPDFRLLRVLKKVYDYEHATIDIFRLANSRYIDFGDYWSIKALSFTSPLHLLWNLQTLIFKNTSSAFAPYDIWKMPHLRHVKIERLNLPDPPQKDEQNNFVLENLQTLMDVKNFKCSEEMVKRIPNVKKLRIYYTEYEVASHYCLNNYCLKNLCHLHKLESLRCSFYTSQEPSRSEMLQNLNFPHSLKKLTLYGCMLHWEDMSTKIGSLPLLQVLRLETNAFVGPEWETVEGQFYSLRVLLIWGSCGLENWTTESTHFPRLEHIDLRHLDKLKGIPSGIGEIQTLQSIQLKYCSESTMISAKEILDEQEELGNEGLLQVQVEFWEKNHQIESWASPNFQVKRWSEN